MNRREDGLQRQLRALHKLLRTYEGIEDYVATLQQRHEEAIKEIKELRREKEMRILEATMRDIFLKRAKMLQDDQPSDNLLDTAIASAEESIEHIRNENDLFRAKILEQEQLIRDLKYRLQLVFDKKSKNRGLLLDQVEPERSVSKYRQDERT